VRPALRALIAVVLVLSCAPSGRRTATRSQLKVRDFQTRTYETKDTAAVMKAVLAALQDEGFIIKTSDTDLGLITATKQESKREWHFIFPKDMVYSWDCTANVTAFERQTSVRTNFTLSAAPANRPRQMILMGPGMVAAVPTHSNESPTPESVREIDDPGYYRNFFAKLDKAIFVQKEKP